VAPTRAVSSATERKTAAGRAPTAIRDRELARPPRDEVRRDAVDADGRQRQGQSGEQPDRQRVESRQGHDVREDGVHRLEVVDAEVAVHGPDLALDGVRDAGRGPLRAHDQAHQAGRGLALREIDDRHDRLLHLMLAEVAHDPHYREPVGPSLGDRIGDLDTLHGEVSAWSVGESDSSTDPGMGLSRCRSARRTSSIHTRTRIRAPLTA